MQLPQNYNPEFHACVDLKVPKISNYKFSRFLDDTTLKTEIDIGSHVLYTISAKIICDIPQGIWIEHKTNILTPKHKIIIQIFIPDVWIECLTLLPVKELNYSSSKKLVGFRSQNLKEEILKEHAKDK
ncbi:hypothetical protein MUP95_09365 [bacterium]|nr:hypothetical protein [bacterium]